MPALTMSNAKIQSSNQIQSSNAKLDGFVKSQKMVSPVIPAKAGIQGFEEVLGSRLRGSDDDEDFLRERQI